jgi:hypothetical protein
MRTMGLIALAALGVGMLLYTEQGKSLLRRTGETMVDGYDTVAGKLTGDSAVGEMVESALANPHPRTAIAEAFEEALA